MKTITVNFAKWRSALILFLCFFYLAAVFSWLMIGWVLLVVVIPIVLMLVWNIRKTWQELTGKRPALVIDRDGIVDNTHWYSLGRVAWEEVDAIKNKQLFFKRSIQVIFKKPSALIQKEKNVFKRIGQTIQLIFNKSPMVFSTKPLIISHNELATLLNEIDFENPDFVDISEHLIDNNR